ncbi:hypothetical protein CHS0354_031220 [Potamilus streckersoni]|uniref:Uncharacterized protein n=1 Tax=Potamilus streckersoni TaxID=2493646 RepID=A0AAE0TKN3_9BIVA|nr:hypothetical protein CHS0354_031220 [Potamilus streckersoni]
MASCLAVTAIICVLITAVATIVAFSTPNWIKMMVGDPLCTCQNCDCGLWLYCSTGSLINNGDLGNCQWFFANDYFIERNLPDWFKAVQGLMSCAIASSLLSLLVGLFSLCCRCKSCNPYQAAGAFINLTFLLLAVSVCVFGAKAYMNHGAVVLSSDSLLLKPVYGWSFWVAVGATAMALITSTLYFCVGRQKDPYK